MIRLGSTALVILVIAYAYVSQYAFVPRQALYVISLIVAILSLRYALSLNIKRSKFILFLIILVASLIVTNIAAAPHFLFALLIALAYLQKKQAVRKMVVAYFYVSLSFFILTLFLFYVGATPDNVIFRSVGEEIVIRSSLGFYGPNSPMLFAFPIVASGLYLFGGVRIYYFFAAAFAFLLYSATDSRTGLACTLLMLGTAYILRHKPTITRRLNNTVSATFILFTVVTLALAMSQMSEVGSSLNELLSNRILFWSYYTNSSDLYTLFGSTLVPERILDNMYLYILVRLGALAWLLYAALYYFGTKYIMRDTRIAIITFFYLLYGVFETNILMAGINFTIPIMLMLVVKQWATVKNTEAKEAM